MTVTDVTGVGAAGVFLIKGKSNFLFEAGMAFAAPRMIDNIKKEIGGGTVEGVLLSHSHYDHVAGLPAVRSAWPGVKVYASRRAREILEKPSALSLIRKLSGEAAEASGLDWNYDYEDKDLKVDEVLEDGDVFSIGEHRIKAFSTTGHTRCSMSYVVDDELMLCSETVGVIMQNGIYMPSFLVDYLAAEQSIETSRRYQVKEIVLNHYGLVAASDRAGIWDVLLKKLRDSKETMIQIMNEYGTDEERLRALEDRFHSKVAQKDQPDEAFDINALSMMRTLRRQFPERFLTRKAV